MRSAAVTDVKALLLDLGNVLVFHDNDLLLRRFAERAGRDPSWVAAQFADGLWTRINTGELGGDAIRAELCQRLGLSLSPEAFFELWNCHFQVYPQMVERVERLVDRLPVVLVSNTNALHAQFLLPRLPVLQRFRALLLSHQAQLAKPDPRFFRAALKTAGVEPHQAAFWDDLPPYVEAARALGIRGHLFRTAEGFDDDLRALGLSAL